MALILNFYRNRNMWLHVLFFLGLSVTTEISFAGKVIDYANEVYSNVRLIEVEGDLVGWRIQIIRTNSQPYVLVQSFEGTPQPPCLVPMYMTGNGTIQFNLPIACTVQGSFTGKFRGNAIVGSFSNGMIGPDGETMMTLSRVH
jgi:hypothetical protein